MAKKRLAILKAEIKRLEEKGDNLTPDHRRILNRLRKEALELRWFGGS